MDRSLFHLLLQQHFKQHKIVFLVGPRQVGKTTLAQKLQQLRGSEDLYRNWDDLRWRQELAKDPYGFLNRLRPSKKNEKPLVVLDEIHKYPKWKRYVKGLWDSYGSHFDLLVTGSGRLDLYQRGGDSLLGRYHQYRLHPLSLKELLNPEISMESVKSEKIADRLWESSATLGQKAKKNFDALLRWGGFPRSFLDQDENQHRLWLKERRQLLLREDLRDISAIRQISHVEHLLELLVLRAGNLLSVNSLREDLQVPYASVRLWMEYLKRLYFFYEVKPWAGKLSRTLKKESKLYLWDWSEIEDEGARFENLIASHLLKWCHFTQDWGYPPLELYFIRDKEKREVDFLITQNKKPWILIEAKLTDSNIPSSLSYFSEKLKVPQTFLVVRDLDRPAQAGNIKVLDAVNFCSLLPV